MARLPDSSSLDTLNPQSNRAVASYRADQVGEAMQNLGQAGLRLGHIAQAEEAQKQEQQSKLEVAYAKSALLRGQLEAQQKLQDDPDYTTYNQRYTDDVAKIRADASAMISNPMARKLFEADADADIARGMNGVQNLARQKEHEYGRASLEDTINQNMDAALSVPDEATRSALHNTTSDAIDGAVSRGYITPEQGVKAKREYAVNSAIKSLEMLSPEDRIKALAPKTPMATDAASAINFVMDKFEGSALVAHDGNKGASKYGINQSANPTIDIKNLTRDEAAQIYKTQYWDQINADSLPDNMKLQAFDTAVNFGVPKAQAMIEASGNDPQRLAELRQAEHARLVAADPQTYGKYQKSWANRDMTFAKTGTSTDFIPADKKMELLHQAQTQLKQEIELRDSDPMTYAQTKGITPNQPLNFNDPSALPAQLQVRAQAAATMRQDYGSPLKVMTNEEAKHFSSSLEQMPTSNKLQYLKTFRDSFDDPNLYQASLQQIRPDSPVTAMAGAYLGLHGKTTTATHMFSDDDTVNPETVATRLVEGEALLNPTKGDKQTDGKGKFPMPSDTGATGLRQAFNEYVGDSFRGNPQTADQAYQAYRAYYAAESAKQGDYSGTMNSDIASLAAKAVIGNVVEKNGKSVVAPWGMDETTFNDMARVRFEDVKKAFGFERVNWDDVGLENTGEPGKYRAIVGAGYLTDAGGKPLTINLGR